MIREIVSIACYGGILLALYFLKKYLKRKKTFEALKSSKSLIVIFFLLLSIFMRVFMSNILWEFSPLQIFYTLHCFRLSFFILALLIQWNLFLSYRSILSLFRYFLHSFPFQYYSKLLFLIFVHIMPKSLNTLATYTTGERRLSQFFFQFPILLSFPWACFTIILCEVTDCPSFSIFKCSITPFLYWYFAVKDYKI